MSLLLCLCLRILLQFGCSRKFELFMISTVSMFFSKQLDPHFGQSNSAYSLHIQQLATCGLCLAPTESSLKCSDQETSISMLPQTWSFVTLSVPHGLLQQFWAAVSQTGSPSQRLSYHQFTESQLEQMCELSRHTHCCQHHFKVQRSSRFRACRTSRHVELKISIGISGKLLFCEKLLFTVPNGVTSQTT